MAVSYDDFVRGWAQTVAAHDAQSGMQEGGAAAFAGERDPNAELQRRFPHLQGMTPQQVEQWARTNGLPDPKNESGLGDFFKALAIPLAFTGAGLATGAFGGLGAAAPASSAPLGSGIAAGANTSGSLTAPVFTSGATTGITSTAPAANAAVGGLGSGIGGAAPLGAGSLSSGFFPAESIGTGTFPETGGGGVFGSGSDISTALTIGGLAKGIPGLMGALAANEQANSYGDIAGQYMAIGEPSRQRFEASFAPDFSMSNDPGYEDAMKQAAKSAMHALSINGNPAGSPNAWGAALQDLYQKNAYNALQEYRRMNAGAGGMAALTSAAPSAAGSAIQAQGNVYGGLGGAAADIFNPPKSLAEVLRELKSVTY